MFLQPFHRENEKNHHKKARFVLFHNCLFYAKKKKLPEKMLCVIPPLVSSLKVFFLCEGKATWSGGHGFQIGCQWPHSSFICKAIWLLTIYFNGRQVLLVKLVYWQNHVICR